MEWYLRVLIATSNQGKLRDFAGAAAGHGVLVEGLPDFITLPEVVEDGATFEDNARKKAEHYSRFAPGEIVLADDSGLSVDVLRNAPGVHSARYAALMGRAATVAMQPTTLNYSASWSRLRRRSAGHALSA